MAASWLLDSNDDSSFAASEIRCICSRAAAFDTTPDGGRSSQRLDLLEYAVSPEPISGERGGCNRVLVADQAEQQVFALDRARTEQASSYRAKKSVRRAGSSKRSNMGGIGSSLFHEVYALCLAPSPVTRHPIE